MQADNYIIVHFSKIYQRTTKIIYLEIDMLLDEKVEFKWMTHICRINAYLTPLLSSSTLYSDGI
jgi:hypothetical protein